MDKLKLFKQDKDKIIEHLRLSNRRLKRQLSNRNTMRFIIKLQDLNSSNEVSKIYEDNYNEHSNLIIFFRDMDEVIRIEKNSLLEHIKNIEVLGDSFKKTKQI